MEEIKKEEKEVKKPQTKKIKVRKKKYWYLFFSMFLLFFSIIVGSVIGIVIMLQPEEENYDIGYSSSIVAHLAAKYQIAGQEEVEIGSINFNPSNGGVQHQTLEFGTIQLTPETNGVVFTYIFTNNDTVACNVMLIDNSKQNNILVRYDIYCEDELLTEISHESFIIQPGQTFVVEQHVSIIDVSKDAYYISSVDNGFLSWVLQKAEGVADA